MKIFLENYNGVLDGVHDELAARGQVTDNPHEADAFLLWQDVRGIGRELALLAKHQLKKTVLVMQHGRGATRDYGAPNKFELIADKILVWGEAEKERLLGYGIEAGRISVVGCPLFQRLKPKAERQGKNILFVPVIAQKEEPENVLVHHVLKIWESEKAIQTIRDNFAQMKKAWAWEENILREVQQPDGTIEKKLWRRDIKPTLPRWLTFGAGLINVKLSNVHDPYQYQSPQIVTGQNDPALIDTLSGLLANVDAMVCLEEGTMQLLAHALDIPVVVVDIFKYGNYGGCPDYDRVEKIKTKACYWINNLDKLGTTLDHALRNPGELSKHREVVCKNEGAIGENACANVIAELNACAERKQPILV